MKKIVGKVSPEERDEIKQLFERKNGLAELARIIGSDDSLYERLVNDMSKTVSAFQKWWDNVSEKYGWESSPKGHWSIDFDTCEVYLES